MDIIERLHQHPENNVMQEAALEIARLRRALSDFLLTAENNQDGLNGAQVGLVVGRLRSELYS